MNDFEAEEVSARIKKLTPIAITVPGIIMTLTSIGLFILGSIAPCNGLHDQTGYFNNTCEGVCCQQPCGTSNNNCQAFPKTMIYSIGGIILGVGIAITMGLYFYKRFLEKKLNRMTLMNASRHSQLNSNY